MDKYEYNVKSDQIKKLYSRKEYAAAAKIADEIEWRKIKDNSMISRVADVYENNREYEKAKETLLIAYERSPLGRQLAYRLTILSLRTRDFVEADEFYQDFVEMSPMDVAQYILKYRISKAKGEDTDILIHILEAYVEVEKDERWQYELAKLYHEAGYEDKCVTMCDDIMLWFNEGKYVEKALKLKQLHKELTPDQQNKLDKKNTERIPDISTVNESETSAKKTERIPNMEFSEDIEELTEQTEGMDNSAQIKSQGSVSNNTLQNIILKTNAKEKERPVQGVTGILKGLDSLLENGQPVAKKQEESDIRKTSAPEKNSALEAIRAAEQAALEAQKAAELAQKLAREAQLKAQAALNETSISEYDEDEDLDIYEGLSGEEISRRLEEEEELKGDVEIESKDIIEIFEFDERKDGKCSHIGEELTKTAEIDIDEINLQLEKSVDNIYDTANIQAALAISMEKIMGMEASRVEEARNPFEQQNTETQLVEVTDKSETTKEPEVETVQEVKEAEPVEEVQEVKEAESIEEIQEVKEAEPVEEIQEVKEAESVEEIQEVKEAESIEEIQEVKEVELVEEIQEVKEAESIEEIQEVKEAESIEEIQEVKEAEPVEEIQKAEEAESVEEVQKAEETESVEEIQESEETEEAESEEIPEDLSNNPTKVIDRAAINRALARQKELFSKISTEEEYDLDEPMIVDDQIEGQMTIEEVLSEYERRKEVTKNTAKMAAAIEAVKAEIAAEEALAAQKEDISDKKIEVSEVTSENETSQDESEADKEEQASEDTAEVTEDKPKEMDLEVLKNHKIPEAFNNMFGDFLSFEGMEARIADTLNNLIHNFVMDGTSKTNNVIITGSSKVGKTTLGLGIIKAANRGRKRSGRKVAKVKATALNKRGVSTAMMQILGTDLIIEQAGNLMPNTLVDLMTVMKSYTEEMLIILEDDKAAIDRMLENMPELGNLFNNRMDIMEFEINDLVKVAKTYAEREQYEIDDIGTLALYAKIDDISGRNQGITFEEIEEIVDDAIEHANRFTFGKLIGKLRKNKSGMSILTEEDFL